jgi:hypothetical protein
VPNAEFMRTLRAVSGTAIVVPARLLERGFNFEFPLWADAARDLCAAARLTAKSR